MEVTASNGSFNYRGAVLVLNIDEDAREADWVKAMGNMHTDPAQPQGGTFSGSPPVLPRNNAEMQRRW